MSGIKLLKVGSTSTPGSSPGVRVQGRGCGQTVARAAEVGVADVGVTTGDHLVSGQQLMGPEALVIRHHQMSPTLRLT